jgi:hypothetical protein
MGFSFFKGDTMKNILFFADALFFCLGASILDSNFFLGAFLIGIGLGGIAATAWRYSNG